MTRDHSLRNDPSGNYRLMAAVHKQMASLSDNRDKPAIGVGYSLIALT